LIERPSTEKAQVFCVKVIWVSKPVTAIERIPLPRESSGTLLIVFKKTANFYGVEMALVAFLQRPCRYRNYEDWCPKGKSLRNHRLVKGYTAKQSQQDYELRKSRVARRTFFCFQTQFTAASGIELRRTMELFIS
jgi:hypothetical protein